ncbi:MAG: citramalate synthase [Planctomycetes bacterium]|nr:citramalate synthase [Planctomycetota bacterium]
MTRDIEIYDTLLRDGSQGEGVSFSLDDKLQITRRLDELGVDYVEGGFPYSNAKDAEYFRKVRELPLTHAKVCAFGMTRRRDCAAADDPGLKALVESGAPVITIVGKAWQAQAASVLRVSAEENLAMIGESVKFLVGSGREVMFDAEHLFDGYKSNAEYARAAIKAAAENGASTIVLCDTNGGTMPDEVAVIVADAVALLSPLGAKVGIHCHNDCELAVANSLAAVDAGAAQVQGTINGFGERCGNANLISLIANLALKKRGYRVLGGRDLQHLTELSRYVYETANMQLANNQPFVGRSAFAHKAGLHAHAVARDTTSYEHLDPTLVGNERRILVSELSGRSNIIAITAKHNLQSDLALMDRIQTAVNEREAQGYQYEAAEASFDLLALKLAGLFKSHFQLSRYHVEITTTNSDGQNHTQPAEATVKVVVLDGEQKIERYEVAVGDGPVNALDAALRKALEWKFTRLREMRLADYKVRVVNGEAGTAARIRVFIEATDGKDRWTTVGVSENVIDASWKALVDAIEYKLCKDEKK